jgi:hypothetical protein
VHVFLAPDALRVLGGNGADTPADVDNPLTTG